MFHLKLSTLRWSLLISAVLLSACSADKYDPTAGWSVDKLYQEAKEELASGAYDKAIGYYEKLEGRAAGTPLAQQAQLDKAWAQYKQNEPAQALATVERFIKLHPASPALDYAIYLKGLINFNDDLGIFANLASQDLAERDPKQAKESFEAFRELITRFPDSKYAPDARLRMTYIRNTLARSDLYIARYYFQKGAYVAAINRAQQTINDFREEPAVEDALIILFQSYDKLGMTQLRDDTYRVLETSFPESKFIKAEKEARAKKKSWWKFW
ncbi:MAG: hypothetical protein RLZZ24_1234 [Pseudomonadota bacterium]